MKTIAKAAVGLVMGFSGGAALSPAVHPVPCDRPHQQLERPAPFASAPSYSFSTPDAGSR